MYEAHQPRKSMAELERAAHIADELGYRRFLRPYAAGATEMLEYAQVRHVAPGLLAALADQQGASGASRPGVAAATNPDMLPAVRAFAFGRGSVLVGERQVSDLEWRSEKSKEMFFYLLQRSEGATKEEIFAALWPDLPESKCNSNFHSSLYRLRRALFHECVVRDSGGAYALNPKGVFASDVDAFNRAMLAADVAKDEEERTQKLEEAVGAYKGGFLSSTYSDWTETDPPRTGGPLRRGAERTRRPASARGPLRRGAAAVPRAGGRRRVQRGGGGGRHARAHRRQRRPVRRRATSAASASCCRRSWTKSRRSAYSPSTAKPAASPSPARDGRARAF